MRRVLVFSVALVVAGAFALGFGLSRGDRATAPVALPSLVDQVREALAARYYRPVPGRVLRLESISAMLSALGDPYTEYLPRADYELLQRETSARYSGIGVSVLPSRGGLLVVSTRPGPARGAGIRAGDTIVQIGHASTAGLGLAQALARISGPRGTPVRIGVARAGHIRTVRLVRREVRAPGVRARLVSFAGRRFGDLRLRSFRSGAAQTLRSEIVRLQRAGAAGFVLDLRQNPGGLLDQAVAVASLFLDRGVVVTLVGAHQPREVRRAVGDPVTRLPLVVLVDRYSASSAEVVAAALRDHRRALLVGERTYGKALVQSIDPLGNGAALELTTARYYTPAGADISDVGLRPDVHAVDRPGTAVDEGLVGALETLAHPKRAAAGGGARPVRRGS